MINKVDKNCILYTRVSSEKQIDGYSLDSQDELCKQKAKQLGYEVIKVFREEGVSGTTLKRPQLQELLAYCRNKDNKIDAVIVYSLSRFSRNTIDYLTLRVILAKQNISLISVSEPTGESPEHSLIETILASFAEYENRARARNVANSLRKRFLEGHITSAPPLGYLMQKVNGKSIVVRDPKFFGLIKDCWYKVLTDKSSIQEITNWMNERNVSRFGKRFQKGTVGKMFQNKFYYGVLVSEKYGETIGRHEPMIDEATFYEVRSILEARRPTKNIRYSRLREDFPLRGIIRCNSCPRTLTSAYSGGSHAKFPYYLCGSRGVHKSISYPKKLLETKFLELLRKISFEKDALNYLSERIKEKYHTRYEQLDNASDWVKEDIKKLKERLSTLEEKHLDGVIEDEDYRRLRDDIKTKLAVKALVLNEDKIGKLDIEATLEFIVFYLENLDKAFIKATPQGRLAIGRSIFPEGLIFKKRAFRTPRLGLAYKLTGEFTNPPVVLGEPDYTKFELLIQEYSRLYKQLGHYIQYV